MIYSNHERVVQHLDIVGKCIQNAINKIKAPSSGIIAGVLMSINATGNNCGWGNLDYLLSMTVPKLGCTVYNVDDKIKELVLKSGDTLMEFLTRAKSVNQSVISAGIKASPNTLLKRFIEQMMLTTLLQTHVISIIMKFAETIKQKGMDYEYQE